MNTEAPPVLPPILPLDTPSGSRDGVSLKSRSDSVITRLLLGIVKFFWGMVFCQSLLGSLLVIGWSYRLAQRFALREWWRRGPLGMQAGLSFAHFLNGSDGTQSHRSWPNWFCQQNFSEEWGNKTGSRSFSRRVRLLLASLRENLQIGLRGFLNTSVLALPGCLLMWFGWYDGWNNSFSKGYEYAAVGPGISGAGILLFIGAMFCLPMAQARQAVTGEWRSFFQFGVVSTVIRQRWLACLGLAMSYSLLALPLHVLKTLPMFLPQMFPELAGLDDEQAATFLNRYFFWCAALMFPAFVSLRIVAAKVYAGGLAAALENGSMTASLLAGSEREACQRLGLTEERRTPMQRTIGRRILRLGGKAGRVCSMAAGLGLWFAFVAQIYVAEFLSYHSALGWVNQPLVQLPWFRFLPTRLGNLSGELGLVFALFLIAMAGGGLRWIYRAVLRPKPVEN